MSALPAPILLLLLLLRRASPLEGSTPAQSAFSSRPRHNIGAALSEASPNVGSTAGMLLAAAVAAATVTDRSRGSEGECRLI